MFLLIIFQHQLQSRKDLLMIKRNTNRSLLWGKMCMMVFWTMVRWWWWRIPLSAVRTSTTSNWPKSDHVSLLPLHLPVSPLPRTCPQWITALPWPTVTPRRQQMLKPRSMTMLLLDQLVQKHLPSLVGAEFTSWILIYLSTLFVWVTGY